MSFELTEHKRSLQHEAASLADRWTPRHRELRRHALERGELHPEFWRGFCDAGYMGLLVPQEYGGGDQGLLSTGLVLEAFAACGIGTSVPVLTCAVAQAILAMGSDQIKNRYLPAIARGQCLFAFAFTEPDSGHNFLRMKTVARRDGDSIIIDGTKTYVSGAELADELLLVARSFPPDIPGASTSTFRGFNAVLVEPNAVGVTMTEQQMGGREGVGQSRLDFDHVVVDGDRLLGREHDGAQGLFGVIKVERVLFTAMALGLAQHCLRVALEHARGRVVFGKRPIGANQAIQHPLATIKAQLEAARLLAYRAAAFFDEGADAQVVGHLATMAKVVTADVAFAAADRALQTLGAAGYDYDLGLVDLFLDARLFRSSPISQELSLSFIAEHVLDLPRSQ